MIIPLVYHFCQKTSHADIFTAWDLGGLFYGATVITVSGVRTVGID